MFAFLLFNILTISQGCEPCADIEAEYFEALSRLKECIQNENDECPRLFREVQVLNERRSECFYGGDSL